MEPSGSDAIKAQMPVVSAGWRFLRAFYNAEDLMMAWPMLDPVLQLCWAQWWLHANQSQITADGYDREQVAQAFLNQAGGHPLWPHFSRVTLRDFREAFPLDLSTCGIGATPRAIALDTETLYVHLNPPAGGLWAPEASSEVIPLVMHLAGGQWRVLNIGNESIPEPGWPPAS